jgi:hypothetical protein
MLCYLKVANKKNLQFSRGTVRDVTRNKKSEDLSENGG